MKKQIAWILGGASIVCLGMLASLDACSSNTETTDGGHDATADTKANDAPNTQDVANDTSQPQDAGADCKAVPSSWPYPGDGSAGPFCPYLYDGGVFADCPANQHCCVPAATSTPSFCSTGACQFAAEAGTNADFQCEDITECTAGQVCCANVGVEIEYDLGCTLYDYAGHQTGSVCASSCATGQAQLCASNAECAGGKTCFPLNTKGTWMGVCVGTDGGI